MIKRKSLWRCILILSIIQLSSSSIFSQEKPSEILISEDYMGKSIIGILKNLSIKYGLRMEYDKSDIDNKMLSVQFYKELALDEVLEKLLAGQDLHFMITSDKKVIIKPIGEELRAVYEPTQFDFSFTGKIVDFESGETLPYANVYVKSTKTGATSNIDGYFTLLNVPSDTSTLVVQYIGYLKEEFHLSPEMLEKGVKIGIQAIGTQLDEVIISDKKEHMMKASEGVSMVKVSPAQLSSLPSLGEKDIFRSLQLLPGISGTNETSSGLYVRGGTPDQNLVLLDGFTVYHVDHFYGFFSAFNANAIKDVQLYKGGFEAKYGGRLSSVVELTGKSGNTNKVSGNVGLSAVTGNASIEVPFADGDGTFLFAGRRSYTDIIQSGLYDDIFTIFNGEEEEAPQVAGPGGRG
ncbi:MAG: ferric enterobactin receptor, partial [Bacteroidia bacterium]